VSAASTILYQDITKRYHTLNFILPTEWLQNTPETAAVTTIWFFLFKLYCHSYICCQHQEKNSKYCIYEVLPSPPNKKRCKMC